MNIAEIVEQHGSASKAFARDLVRSCRVFPNGWWHGTEIDLGIELMQNVLAAELKLHVSLPTVSLTSFVEEQADSVLDDASEDKIRRLTIELAVKHINQQLVESDKQFHRFVEFKGWEEDEPLWLLLSPQEVKLFLAANLLSPAKDLDGTTKD